MPTRPNLDKEAAAEPGSDARIKVLLYLSRRPAGSTAAQICQGTQLAPDLCRAALAGLEATSPDTPPLVRRQGKPALFFVPMARHRRSGTLVPGFVAADAPTPAPTDTPATTGART